LSTQQSAFSTQPKANGQSLDLASSSTCSMRSTIRLLRCSQRWNPMLLAQLPGRGVQSPEHTCPVVEGVCDGCPSPTTCLWA
jgi:hypothetical protein